MDSSIVVNLTADCKRINEFGTLPQAEDTRGALI